MSKEVVLITGGARSGKSKYAEKCAISKGTRLFYLATGEARDEEMAQRIAEHRKRRGKNWMTVEEPMEVSKELRLQKGKIDCAVIDCLTLWISNLLIQQGEEAVYRAVDVFINDLPNFDFHVFLVTNEVGWGIVPDNPLARQFRDLTGWSNQRMAKVAKEVVLMVAGIPFPLKKRKEACS